jgi:hypothetical protein
MQVEWIHPVGAADRITAAQRARLRTFERIDHVLCPDMRDRTATEELLQDARPDFDQKDSGAMTSQGGNERSQCKNAGSINTGTLPIRKMNVLAGRRLRASRPSTFAATRRKNASSIP